MKLETFEPAKGESVAQKSRSSIDEWASDGISAARFNAACTHIERVLAHPIYCDAIGTPAEYVRQNIIGSIKAGVNYITILRDNTGEWKRGSSIQLVNINGKEYLKTTDNTEEADDLGELPSC